jgi:hypothetical protein
MLRTFFAGAVIASSSVFCAVAQDASVCTPLITEGLKEHYQSYSAEDNLIQIYDHFCSTAENERNQTWNASVSAVIEEIPTGLKGGETDTKKAFMNFCRQYTENRANSRRDVTITDHVVAKGYDTFIDCVRIAGKNQGSIYHKLNGKEIAVVFLRPDTITPIQLDGVTATDNVKCTAQSPEIGNLDQIVNVIIHQPLNISCKRNINANDNGYSEANVTILTNLGPYDFVMPAIPSDDLLARIKADLEGDYERKIKLVEDDLESFVPKDVTVISEIKSLACNQQDLTKVVCPVGWDPKSGDIIHTTHEVPIQHVTQLAIPGGYVFKGTMVAGCEYKQLFIAAATCERKPISDMH